MEGRRIRDSVEMIQTAFYPVQMAAEKGIQLYRRKKQRDRMSQKKRSSRVHSDTEHAQVSNKMRRKAAGKKETGRKGQKKSRQSGSGVHSFVKSQMLNSFLDKFSTEKEFSQDGLIEGTTKISKGGCADGCADDYDGISSCFVRTVCGGWDYRRDRGCGDRSNL